MASQKPRLHLGMARPLSKLRPKQGARLLKFRQAAGFTQTQLATFLGVPQQTIAFWEQSEKPPRSDLLPMMAEALGVSVEQLVVPDARPPKRNGPVGRTRKAFQAVSQLPRRQQEKIIDVVDAMLSQYRRNAG